MQPLPQAGEAPGRTRVVEKQLLGPELLVWGVPGVAMEGKAILDLT